VSGGLKVYYLGMNNKAKEDDMNKEPIHPALWDKLPEEKRKVQEEGFKNWRNHKHFTGSKAEVK